MNVNRVSYAIYKPRLAVPILKQRTYGSFDPVSQSSRPVLKWIFVIRMEEAFKKLQKDNQNTVDNLMMWMQYCKMLDGKMVTKETAMKMFAEVKDASNVELAKFEEAIGKIAEEQKMAIEEFCETLVAEFPKFLDAVLSAASAAATTAAITFKEAMNKK